MQEAYKMRVLLVEGFENVDDPVLTEQQISKQLISLKEKIISEYVYVCFPLAYSINTRGLAATQKIINDICSQFTHEKLFFVCQHIQVCNLNFHNNLVFTPHATTLDPFQPMPHYSCNFDTSYSRPWEEREYHFSFMGDYNTHTTRKRMYEALKDYPKSIFVDTKKWHFYSDDKVKKINSKNYIELLGNTKYSLCPRGTGPSTIRIWESMAMNSCPIILSDILKMPLEMFIIEEIWKRRSEDCSNFNISEHPYDNKEYFDLFSNDNLYKSISYYL